MDKTQEKMNFVTKKLSTMLKTSDMGTLYTIMCLSFILFILVALVIVTWRKREESSLSLNILIIIDDKIYNFNYFQ